MIHFESKFHTKGRLSPGGNQIGGAWVWLALALLMVMLWLLVHYIIRPGWTRMIPQSVSEFLFLMEMATILTLGSLTMVSLVRTYKKRKNVPATSIEELYALSPVEFEQYVAALFRKKGYRVKVRGRKGDKGVDLELSRPDGREAIVQCKRYRHTIGPDIIRELFGTMVHERVHHAFLVTTADISDSAKEWASTKPITLIDGPALVKIANSVSVP